MKRKKIKQLGADNLRQLIDKMNELNIRKDSVIQILQIGTSFTLIYEG